MTAIKKTMTVGLLLGTLWGLTGCNDQYRYPCQDPANWETAQCQKPVCEINRSCPEHIFPEKFACNKE